MNLVEATSQRRPVNNGDLETLLKERDPKYRHKILPREETREICQTLHELRHQQAIIEVMPSPNKEDDQATLQGLIYNLENYILDHNWLYLGKLARKIKQRYRDLTKDLEFEALVRAGAMGLLKATQNFDLSHNNTLLTFATRHIWGQMIEELRRHVVNNEFINFKPAERLLAQVEKKFKEKHKTKVMDDETFAAELGLRHQDLMIFREEVSRLSSEPASLEAPLKESDGLSIARTIEDDSQIQEIYSDDFKAALRLLGERKQQIIALRYGLAIGNYNKLGHQLTQEEVGKLFKISRERVRQLESQALEELANVLNVYQNKYYWIPNEIDINGLITLFDHLFEEKQKIFKDFDEFTEALLLRLKQEKMLYRDKETNVLTMTEFETLRALIGFEGPEMMMPKLLAAATGRREAAVLNCSNKAIHKIYTFFKYMSSSELKAFFRGELSSKELQHYDRNKIVLKLYDYLRADSQEAATADPKTDKS